MKMGRAATFTLWVFAHASKTGEVCFKDWKEFEEAFQYQFFPLHKCTHAMNQLESHQYHQGKCSVDEYIDKFEELIKKAEYMDGLAIVMIFQQGLDSSIQTCITLMLEGHLKEDQPLNWYTAARVVALTHAANKAFQAPRTTLTTTTSSFAGIHRGAEGSNRFLPPPVVCLNIIPVIPAPPMASGPTPMDVDAAKWQFSTPLTCRCCGKVGHFA